MASMIQPKIKTVSSVVILHERDIDQKTITNILRIDNATLRLDLAHTQMSLSTLLETFTIIIIDVRTQALFDYWAANRVSIPETCAVLFLKPRGQSYDSLAIKQEMNCDHIIKELVFPQTTVPTVAEFIRINSIDAIKKSIVRTRSKWIKAFRCLMSIVVKQVSK